MISLEGSADFQQKNEKSPLMIYQTYEEWSSITTAESDRIFF